MDLRDYLRILRKRWLSIAIITALGVAIGAGYSLMSPKIYRATAQNFVAISGAVNSASTGSSFALQRVKSYVELVDTPEVLAPVIAQTGVDLTVPQLAATVSASNPPQTVLLNVAVTDSDQALA
ncbi:MAG: tyrosine-protein kinase, partial [Actinomycetota bacterium]|nr:tyrosine-protein kinase [Actinomycetota bacterium]